MIEYRIYYFDKGKWNYLNTEMTIKAAQKGVKELSSKGFKTYIENNKWR